MGWIDPIDQTPGQPSGQHGCNFTCYNKDGLRICGVENGAPKWLDAYLETVSHKPGVPLTDAEAKVLTDNQIKMLDDIKAAFAALRVHMASLKEARTNVESYRKRMQNEEIEMNKSSEAAREMINTINKLKLRLGKEFLADAEAEQISMTEDIGRSV